MNDKTYLIPQWDVLFVNGKLEPLYLGVKEVTEQEYKDHKWLCWAAITPTNA